MSSTPLIFQLDLICLIGAQVIPNLENTTNFIQSPVLVFMAEQRTLDRIGKKLADQIKESFDVQMESSLWKIINVN